MAAPALARRTCRWGRRLVGLACVAFLAPLSALAEPPAKRLSKEDQAKQNLLTAQAEATAAATAALKAELEKRIKEQDEASRKREETLREEARVAVASLKKSAEEQLAEEKAAREKEVAGLRAALDASKAEQEKRQSETPTVGTAGQGVSLYGLVQSDLMFQQGAQDQINPDDGQPLNTDRFLIRRARLGLQLERKHGEGGLELDGNTVNGPTFRLIDAHASVKVPGRSGAVPLLMATIGLTRIPFGAEVPQADRDRFFLERSLAARALFPDEYDVGLRLMGGWQFVRYAIAVQNGEPVGAGRFAGLDPNKRKDVVGRLGVEDEVVEGVFVKGGASILRGYGFHTGKQPTKNTVAWNDANSNGTLDTGEIVGVPGSTASSSSSFSRFAVGGDLMVSARTSRLGNTAIAANVYFANDLDRALQPADPLSGSTSGQARSFRELGYSIALTQQLTRLAAIGVRYDYYDPDRDAYNRVVGNIVPSDSSYKTISVTGIAYGPGWGRLIAQFDINRNHLGLDSLGTPSNLASNAFTLRGEVFF